MLFISIGIYLYYPKETNIKTSKKQVFFFILLITTYLVGFTNKNPIKIYKSKSKALMFEGQNIHNTPLHLYTPISKDSIYMMYFFSYSCPHCLNSIENMKQYTASNYVKNIVLIGTGEDFYKKDFYNSFDLDFQRFDIDKKAMHKITDRYPVSYFIVNDTIRKIWQGTLPVHQNLNKIKFLE